ncbi:cationic peroxidase SPC4-like [Hordeum vulgare subsp. vulgare]|uniref:Peroxidase n=1 Tax=Hordeum vulgare subsp. vulgare TaxID=112509 RepID=A0A8I6X154_HORVV|nr:cationic peroxidase SPC4-like [Hordeum vulgare subsp. vulgare]
MACSRAMVAIVGLVIAGLLFPAASSSMRPDQLITMTTDGQYHSTHPVVTIADGLTADYHDVSCPDLRGIVRTAVVEALQGDITIAADLLRMFFHDCFPQGCDASILLLGTPWSEMRMPPNLSLDKRRKVAFLMEDIRAKVHKACGPTVSCADIMALATHDAVVASGGKPYHVPLGRLDSSQPAPRRFVEQLPPPTFSIDQLIGAFSSRSLDEKDLVVLSGAHTIGKARCATFSDRFTSADSGDFVRRLQDNCTTDVNRRQDLDVTTPEKFDNKYYINLKEGKGVLTSDVQLLLNESTRAYVNDFADNEWWFWNQFGTSMSKMGMLQGPQGNVGRIRRHCY